MDPSTQMKNAGSASDCPRLYTQADVSERCRLSRSHLYSLLARRQFPAPALRLGPKFTRWSSADVDEWVRDPQGWIDRHAHDGGTA